ncbi:hypothetical protein [Nocardia bhagyanarayanae]|uniref:Uncharacterized protein n=1 Tax=Nocardia bhagyanarayanae TaxID=1215925 RepID=A0A543FFR2_9NOCA|nr:hypothetical protein [Nocardia bhagyanarayanae]TQM32697.1 hypothetical protein FB390_4392 [Nocardia bhagyanarayanae]
MRKPTALEKKVLQTLQDLTAENTAISASGREPVPTATEPQLSVTREEWDDRVAMAEALKQAALAGGIPSSWVAHVTERGEKGRYWHPDLWLRPAEQPVDRAQILAGLRADADLLRSITGLQAAAWHFDLHRADEETSSTVDLVMDLMWQRMVSVARLAAVTAQEARGVWGDAQTWARSAVTDLGALDRARVAAAWSEAARLNAWSYGWQAIGLAEAGVKPKALQRFTPPPKPTDLVELIQDELAVTGTGAGTAIAAANLTRAPAAGVESDSGAALFSDSSGSAEAGTDTYAEYADWPTEPTFSDTDGRSL